ncbi:hypothetical protein [Alkalihalobacterium bogoriense]|uniref:hypothetical protein n=1 Tax=Alkalihalobacterium bogoriense TaxID=246272 RepID=UPI0012ECB2A4|nr:hypothetical protein [Alkalihalobacterium bogoriense]
MTNTSIQAKVDSIAVEQPSAPKRVHVFTQASNLSVQELTKNIDQSPIIFFEQTSPAKKKKRACCYARVSSGDEDSFSSFQFQIVNYTYFIHKNPD